MAIQLLKLAKLLRVPCAKDAEREGRVLQLVAQFALKVKQIIHLTVLVLKEKTFGSPAL